MTNTFINNEQNLTPTIICVAESTHYLVGKVDSLNNLMSLNAEKEVAVTSSLTEAKNYLRKQNIFTASLEFQSAYDEMCGLDAAQPCRQTITF
jgi:hypothetical protein